MREAYYIKAARKGEIDLYETDGDFYDHDTQDLLVATFYDEDEAEKILKVLNKHYSE
ncbi:hypothetical protein IFU39_16305 [Paenibacillus sp. CFBP 13594]|uniref:hypothetical protein n=1 Tax=Paenibacillus sp. CFBP 13594 TaxID=2774037 RepID=UPI001786D2C6|nr:hypothetical protein [Paenibacillus sp. CFBP 13594]MBD8839375.1 hypothetical protein [Paenibacillus sp. CFBP 13594]